MDEHGVVLDGHHFFGGFSKFSMAKSGLNMFERCSKKQFEVVSIFFC